MSDARAAPQPPSPDAQPPDEPGPRRQFDAYGHYQSARAQQRSLKAFPAVARSALVLARRASPKLFWSVLAGQALAAALLGLQVLLGKLAIQAVLTEAGEPQGSIRAALPPLLALAAASAMAGLLTSGQTLLQRLLGEKVQRLTWRSVLAVTTAVPLADFEDPAFFDDLQRVKVNAITRPLTLATGLVAVVGGGLSVAGLGVALFVIEPLLPPILLLGGLPLAYLSRRSGRMEFAFALRQTPQRRMRTYYELVLSGRDEAKEVRAFDLGDPMRTRWDENYWRYFKDFDRHIRDRILLAAAGALTTAVVTSVALGLLIYFVVEDRLTLATAAAALIAIRLFASRVQQLFTGISQLFESSLFLQDLQRFLARVPESRPGRADRTTDAPADLSELVAESVSFRYPGSDHDALSDVSVRIGEGETVALVGANGSGKTTLAKLLAQMYEPTGGRILWNGVDTRRFDARALREHVGVIFQDFVRYQLTARDNIGLGRPDALDDLERIVAAARRGGADEHIERLPQGYETSLGKEFKGGYDLSGGQWQRVALSRAFFRDADLLVLDEPTAALDARSEHEIFEHVRELAEGRSLLLISHRFSTVRSADRIYVLERGRVVEEGSHEALMALEGRYAELFELQASAYR